MVAKKITGKILVWSGMSFYAHETITVMRQSGISWFLQAIATIYATESWTANSAIAPDPQRAGLSNGLLPVSGPCKPDQFPLLNCPKKSRTHLCTQNWFHFSLHDSSAHSKSLKIASSVHSGLDLGWGWGWVGWGANNNIHVSRHIAGVHTHRALGWGWVAKRRLQWIQWKGMHYRQVQKIQELTMYDQRLETLRVQGRIIRAHAQTSWKAPRTDEALTP